MFTLSEFVTGFTYVGKILHYQIKIWKEVYLYTYDKYVNQIMKNIL